MTPHRNQFDVSVYKYIYSFSVYLLSFLIHFSRATMVTLFEGDLQVIPDTQVPVLVL